MGWRTTGALALFCVVRFTMPLLEPESSRFLVGKGKDQEPEAVRVVHDSVAP